MIDAIVVPTHARPDVVGAKTLRLLAERGIPRDLVHLVVDEAEHERYAATVDRGLYADLLPGAATLVGQRNAVMAAFPEGARVVSCDDDLTDLRRRVDEKTTEPADLPPTFERGFAACESAGATLWGVYPILNPYFMRPTTTTGLAFCIGQCHGIVNTHEEWARLSAETETKEDYEQTLIRYEHDGAVVRMNDVAPKSRMHAKGGIDDRHPDRATVNRRAVMALLKRYPSLVRVSSRRSRQGLEISLRRS